MHFILLILANVSAVYAADTPINTLEPATAAIFTQAEDAFAAGDLNDALAAYQKVQAAAPRFDRAWRRSCGAYLGLSKVDQAVQDCKHAVSLRDSPENQTGLAIALLQKGGALASVKSLVDEVVREAPTYLPGWQALCAYSLRAQHEPTIRQCLLGLQRIEPNAPAIPLFAALIAAYDGNKKQAHRKLDQAEHAGVNLALISAARTGIASILEKSALPSEAKPEPKSSFSGVLPIIILGIAVFGVAIVVATDKPSDTPPPPSSASS